MRILRIGKVILNCTYDWGVKNGGKLTFADLVVSRVDTGP